MLGAWPLRPDGSPSATFADAHRTLLPREFDSNLKIPKQKPRHKRRDYNRPRRECSGRGPFVLMDRLRRRSLTLTELSCPVSSIQISKYQNKNPAIKGGIIVLVSPARIELTAPGLGNLCSIRLSYGDRAKKLNGFHAVF